MSDEGQTATLAEAARQLAAMKAALDALGAGPPQGDRCQTWTPCINAPVVHVLSADWCADHAPKVDG